MICCMEANLVVRNVKKCAMVNPSILALAEACTSVDLSNLRVIAYVAAFELLIPSRPPRCKG